MKKTIQDKMHQYISFRAHLIYIAHRQLVSIKKHRIKEHSKKKAAFWKSQNAAFWNSLSPCEQTESYIYSLAELKRRAIANGTKYPPKKYDSPLLNFTIEQHDLNEFSDEAHKSVRQLDIQYILTQTTLHGDLAGVVVGRGQPPWARGPVLGSCEDESWLAVYVCI